MAVVAGGMQVGSVKLYPDGTIELSKDTQDVPPAMNDFEQLDRDGLL